MAEFKVPPAPSKIADDYDLDAFRLSPSPTVSEGKIEVKTVRVEKPRASDYVFLHPDWRDYYWILPGDFKKKREAHLVLPQIAVNHQPLCKHVMLVPYCDESGDYFLWPVPQEDVSGKINDFHQSLMQKMTQAIGLWARFEANFKAKGYEVYVATEQREAPLWPFESLDAMTKIAFAERFIRKSDHSVLGSVVGRKLSAVGHKL
jgi:hypothetical protein